MTRRVPGRNFNSRRQTDLRTEKAEADQRDLLDLKTNNLTNRGAPVRFLKDLATLMTKADLASLLKTNGFY